MKFILKNWVWTWIASMLLVIAGALLILLESNRIIADSFLVVGLLAFVIAFIGLVQRLLRLSSYQTKA